MCVFVARVSEARSANLFIELTNQCGMSDHLGLRALCIEWEGKTCTCATLKKALSAALAGVPLLLRVCK